jgi:hypothetical protein
MQEIAMAGEMPAASSDVNKDAEVELTTSYPVLADKLSIKSSVSTAASSNSVFFFPSNYVKFSTSNQLRFHLNPYFRQGLEQVWLAQSPKSSANVRFVVFASRRAVSTG